MMRCFTCEKKGSCLCFKCFISSNHSNHKFTVISGSGVCDCGNLEFMSQEGFCEEHQGHTFEREMTPNLEKLKANLMEILLVMLYFSSEEIRPDIPVNVREDIFKIWTWLFVLFDRLTGNRNVLLLLTESLKENDLSLIVSSERRNKLLKGMLETLRQKQRKAQNNLDIILEHDPESKFCRKFLEFPKFNQQY